MRALRNTLGFALVVAAVLCVPAAGDIYTNIAWAKRDLDADYFPDDSTSVYVVRGRITSSSFATNNATELFIQDTNDSAGIQVYASDFSLDPAVFSTGREMQVTGYISQYRGLRQIQPAIDAWCAITDATPVAVYPLGVTVTNLMTNAELYEGTLVIVSNVRAGVTWPAWGAQGTLTITDATGRLTMFIDVDMDLDGQLRPTNAFDVQGIFAQYTTNVPPSSGYQIWPRRYADIVQYTGPQPPAVFVANSNNFGVAVGENLEIQFLGLDRNAADALVLRTNQAPAGSSFTDYGNREARFQWTPDASAMGTTTPLVVEVLDGTFTGSVTVTLHVLSEEEQNVVINEIHYDPDVTFGDANGDGTSSSSQDEFVEIVNNNTGTFTLTGWILRFGTNHLFTFPATVLTGSTAVVVFGGGSPSGTFGHATVYASSTWGGGLVNTPAGRAVNLLSTGGFEIVSYEYDLFDSSINQSITRDPDMGGGFVIHTLANPYKRYSPGTRSSGAAFEGTGITNNEPQLVSVADTVVQPGGVKIVPVRATDPEGDPITLTASNGPATATFVDNGDGTGVFSYTGLVADAGSNFAVVVSASDGKTNGTELFRLQVTPTQYVGLLINEYLVDPVGTAGTGVDANNDGATNSSDAFVEIVNQTSNNLDMAGFIVSDAVAIRHRFTSELVRAGGAIVVFDGGSTANFTNPPAQLASTGRLFLDDPDSVVLYSPQTTMIDRVDFSGLNQAESYTRNPDITGPFTNHLLASGGSARASPGRRVDGSTFLPGVPVVDITNPVSNVSVTNTITSYDVQGTCNTNVVGELSWTNSLTGGAGTLAATDTWVIVGLALDMGPNVITVRGTNGTGLSASDSVIITREGSGAGAVWINEVDYDSVGTDTNEWVELIGTAGLALSDYELVMISQAGSVYNTFDLAPAGWTFSDETNGYGFFLVGIVRPSEGAADFTPTGWAQDEIQNGATDSIQLRKKTGPVNVHLLDYEGNNATTAEDQNTTAADDNATALNSIYLTGGPGDSFDDFTWTNTSGTATPGAINTGQLLSSPSADADGDGIPDWWEVLYFTNTAQSGTSDYDHDLLSNLEEYLGDTIPTSSNSFFEIGGILQRTNRLISFLSSTARVYTFQFAVDPRTGDSWSNLQTDVPGIGALMTLSDTNITSGRFYRVRVRPP